MTEIWDDFLSTRHDSLEAAAKSVFQPQEGTLDRVTAIQLAQRLIAEYATDDWQATKVLVARLRLREATLLSTIDEDDLALTKLAELAQAATSDDELGEASADARHGLARLLWVLQRRPEAFTEIRRLIAETATRTHAGTRYTHALAQNSLIGWIRQTTGPQDGPAARERILEAARELVRDHQDSGNPPEIFYVLQALRLQLDLLREEINELREAGQDEAAGVLELRIPILADDAWDRFHEVDDSQVQAAVADLLLESRDRLGAIQARPSAEKVLAAYLISDEPDLAPELTWALSVRAGAQRRSGEIKAAEATLSQLQERFADSTNERVRNSLLWAATERGILANQAGRVAEAIELMVGQLTWLDQTYPEGDASDGVRHRVAQALDLAADFLLPGLPPEIPDDLDGANGADLSAVAEPRVAQVEQNQAELDHAAAIERLVVRFAADPDPDIREIVAQAIFNLAGQQRARHHLDESEASYRRLIGLYGTDPGLELLLARAAMNLGFLLLALKSDHVAALKVYDEAIQRHQSATNPALRDVLGKIASSRLNCANLATELGLAVSYGDYEELTLAEQDEMEAIKGRIVAADEAGRDAEAIELCDQILVRIESLHPELRRRCLDALTRKAHHLHRLGRYQEALALNNAAVLRYGDALETSLLKDIAYAMLNRGFNLDKLGRHEEEVIAYTELIERFSDASVRYIKQRVSMARFSLGVTLADLGRAAEAEAVYRDSMRIDLPSTDPERILRGVRSAVNLSVDLGKDERQSESLRAGLAAAEACANRSDVRFRTQLAKAKLAVARARRGLGESAAAIEAYQEMLAVEPEALSDSLRATGRRELTELQDRLPPTSTRERLRRWILGRAAERG